MQNYPRPNIPTMPIIRDFHAKFSPVVMKTTPPAEPPQPLKPRYRSFCRTGSAISADEH